MTNEPWTMSSKEHDMFLACRSYILDALSSKMMERTGHPDTVWIPAERMAVAVAANEWAQAHSINRHVTVADVERVETSAVGHVDYGPKLALYVAELLYIDRLGVVESVPEERSGQAGEADPPHLYT